TSFETSREILKRVEAGEEAVTSTSVVQEIVDWLEYNRRRSEVKTFLTAINSYTSLRKDAPSWEDMVSALDYMEADAVGYVDALTLQLMKKNNIDEIYSNDKDFDRVKWIKRIWE
ncbi:MAG: type II toxin-antitoxin system VapC family toxin, partial [Crenarchaeota archaeon]|nr:type II toxin-antitoxin system VapC family toxin [Thermoproteota archaeon]